MFLSFQIQVPDPGMLVWQRAENDRKKYVKCVRENGPNRTVLGGSTSVFGTSSLFLAFSAGLAFGFFVVFSIF